VKSRHIYLASSWRNLHHAAVFNALTRAGHVVYNFKEPHPGEFGFHWTDVDGRYLKWTADEFVKALEHPACEKGFTNDSQAMIESDTCVLLLPSGRSAHLEAGVMAGEGKDLHILIPEHDAFEPELMYKFADQIHTSIEALIGALA
jgi:hypothetical protein